jgi:hypothetical protein
MSLVELLQHKLNRMDRASEVYVVNKRTEALRLLNHGQDEVEWSAAPGPGRFNIRVTVTQPNRYWL